jgi:AraC family transcriptional regulator of adaptative response / DNA-3-methyladenine glycosylase II
MDIEPEICYRAVKARDARFDGRFFTAVRTTGIYCRPICPATAPKAENCLFFSCAAAAQEAGFRPCLRCRPELSPDLLHELSKTAVVARALRLIDEGLLDSCSIEDLATKLGMGERQLRRLFQEELGASPLVVAQTKRILLAKQLLIETGLSMTDVAMASGFGSIRRFNDVIRREFSRMPSDLRRSRTSAVRETISVALPFRPPYNWQAIVEFLKMRATPGVEEVSDLCYMRTISLNGINGVIKVEPELDNNCLRLTIQSPQLILLPQIVSRVKRMFDCSANMESIDDHLKGDRKLAAVINKDPGVRVPGTWDKFELAIRAILGQQISVRAATTLAGRMASSFGQPLDSTPDSDVNAGAGAVLKFLFPSAQALSVGDLTTIGLTKARAAAISALSAAVAEDPELLDRFTGLSDAVSKLCRLPGIGEWTAQYIAMRALREPDAFPSTDLVLLQAMADESIDTSTQLLKRAESWRPWRAYAAMYLWRSTKVAKEECEHVNCK